MFTLLYARFFKSLLNITHIKLKIMQYSLSSNFIENVFITTLVSSTLFAFMFSRGRSLILLLFTTELLFLIFNIFFIFTAMTINDINPQWIAFIILCIAGAEAAIGIALILAFYKRRGTITIDHVFILHH